MPRIMVYWYADGDLLEQKRLSDLPEQSRGETQATEAWFSRFIYELLKDDIAS